MGRGSVMSVACVRGGRCMTKTGETRCVKKWNDRRKTLLNSSLTTLRVSGSKSCGIFFYLFIVDIYIYIFFPDFFCRRV